VVYDGDEAVLRIPVVMAESSRQAARGRSGDARRRVLCLLQESAESKYHRFLGLSYPGVEDAERGVRDGLITAAERDAICAAIAARQCPPWKTALGGEVGLHGPWPQRDMDAWLRGDGRRAD